MLNAQVLGRPTEDNALFVTADSGQGRTRLLLDCGMNTVSTLPLAEVQQIDHLLFSHLHIDHVAGFDAFFRANFDRYSGPPGRENHIWGPPGTAQILGHRFQGYWWNHAPELRGTWRAHDVDAHEIRTFRFEAQEAFATMHAEGVRLHDSPLIGTPEVTVEALPLSHQGLCLGYVVREPERVSVDAQALKALGLKGGPWLAALKAGAGGPLDVHGEEHGADELRARLLQRQPGESLAYLTDFLLNRAEQERIAPLLSGVQTLYMEAQYAPEDADLAARHHHTTVVQGAALARAAGVTDLCLLHLSRRYRREEWAEMLTAARAIFPAVRFPEGWLEG
ncbi:MBL fold metallo-hydrolase [Deinococcus hopiensis]|uniref:Ribonuclease Z n=1 Tax=Deinococcus hopiensis KR-140 TaxID=695939 RepID=A0A1W1VMN8_9DEIO|nr:MBL fold metallo-hydrolase [Deinococcus hopiensis]SMB94588.1 ribonuclease Z [Deinococcus hopiensis KR-140]